jgi:hypothetical protein
MTDTTLYPIFVRQGRSKTRFKVGYINQRGEVVIDPIFDYATRFYEGLAAVEVRNRWGVINASGEFTIQPQSWGWCRFRDGLASISVRGKWGVIDRTGKFVLKPKYDYLGSFKEGLALCRAGELRSARYGFVDRSGTEVTRPVFHDAQDFSEGLAAAKVGNLWGYIDPSGAFKITPRFDGAGAGKRWPDTRAGYFTSGLAPVWSGQDSYRFIDTTGAFAFDRGFDDANSFCEGRAVIKLSGRYGFIEPNGETVIECRFTLARDFSEGLARVQEKESRPGFPPRSGFIDLHGQMAIEPAFRSAESFHDGLSLVTTEDSIGYINELGEYVWQAPYVEYGVLL